MTVEELKRTDEFREYGYTIVTCPICGNPTLDMFWICDECGWEFDGAIVDDQYSSANKSTVRDYKIKYQGKKNLITSLNPSKQNNTKESLCAGFAEGMNSVSPLLSIRIKRCSDTAILPSKAHPTDACYDLYADLNYLSIEIPPRSHVTINSGFCTEIPRGYFAAVFARSGLGCKHGIRLANSVGIIDADYRGEWRFILHNDRESPFIIHHGDRVAQFTILPVLTTELIEVPDLSETERGAGGFGSSGS